MAGEIYVILMYEAFSTCPHAVGYTTREEDAINFCAPFELEEDVWYSYKRIPKIEIPTYDGGWDS